MKEKDDELLKTYFKSVGKYKVLSKEEEFETAKRMSRGDEKAREMLINSNLRLVVYFARKYSQVGGLRLLDLIQEGNIGLIQAAEKFDYKKGFRFSTFAIWWINQSIIKAKNFTARTIRIPTYMAGNIKHLDEKEVMLEQLLGRAPTVEEVAKEMKKTPEYIRKLHAIDKEVSSLDVVGDGRELSGGEYGQTIGDMFADPNSEDIVQKIHDEELQEKIQSAIKSSCLSEKEQYVIGKRYMDGMTLQDTGDTINVSREYIRQVENNAKTKLREIFINRGIVEKGGQLSTAVTPQNKQENKEI